RVPAAEWRVAQWETVCRIYATNCLTTPVARPGNGNAASSAEHHASNGYVAHWCVDAQRVRQRPERQLARCQYSQVDSAYRARFHSNHRRLAHRARRTADPRNNSPPTGTQVLF